MPAAIAIPAIATAIAGGAAAGASIYGAHKTSSAATHAADLQTQSANHAADIEKQSADAALAFQKQQADQTAKQAEIDRKANYDQWAAQQAQHNRVREALGYPTSPIPAYVPGVTPNFTGAPAGPARPPMAPTSPLATGMPSVGTALAPRAPAPQGPAQMAAPAQSAYQPMPGSPLTMPPIGSVDDYLMRVRA